MNKITVFTPGGTLYSSAEELIASTNSAGMLQPFCSRVVDFVAAFSKSVLLDRACGQYPELIVLANFFRRNNIEKLSSRLTEFPDQLVSSRGVVFNLAPSNVDSVFLYSSFMSLLCGNINLIRVSRQPSPLNDLVYQKLNTLLKDEYSDLSSQIVIFTYEHDRDTTEYLSLNCDMRVVWGGDRTVKEIKSIPLKPTALEICFPDRFSLCMISADKLNNAEQAELANQFKNFYNDTTWFAQQACSSPRLVSWIGTEDACSAARKTFWDGYSSYLEAESYENSGAMTMERLVATCMASAISNVKLAANFEYPSRLLLPPKDIGSLRDNHCGNGLFYEQVFPDIASFFRTMTDKEQTVSVYGFSADEIRENLTYLGRRSVDRFVNVGHSLDFNCVWDGYNLIEYFCRRIVIDLDETSNK